MPVNLKGRHLLTVKDFTTEELEYLLKLSANLKDKKRAGIRGDLLDRKNIVIVFDKSSTRTRTAFEVGAFDEGGSVTYLTNSQMGKKETIKDTARVLGRSYDGIAYRGFSQELVEELAKYAGIPVWNGLTDLFHPTQMLADYLTMMEHVDKPLNKMKFVYAGDARNNMGNSLLVMAAKMGVHFVGLAPKSLWPDEALVKEMQEVAKETGAVIELSEDIDSVKGADVIYTDVWVSMGEPDEVYAERIKLLMPYQVNKAMMEKTGNKDVIFLHCLPSFHNDETQIGMEIKEKYGIDAMEVTDEVFESSASKVFDQAENRMHTIKAVMVATAGKL